MSRRLVRGARLFRPEVPAAGVSYLLRAPFTASDQGFADGQVLTTVAEGVTEGQLTVVEKDGTLAIVGNECAFTAQGTPTWTDLGYVGELRGGGAFTKALGRGLVGIVDLNTWEEMGMGWHDAAAVVDPDNFKYALQAITTDGQVAIEGGTIVYTGLALGTDYRWCIVLGGFDANGVPYYIGQPVANYLYGAWYLLEVSGTYHLIWLDQTDDTAALYAILSSLDAVGTVHDFDVPDVDLSNVQAEITNLSTFTAPNGTSLDAITPEVGGAWTEQNGDWDIQGNRAEDDNSASSIATVAGLADGLLMCTVRPTASGASAPSTVYRYQDNNNYWHVQVAQAADRVRIREVNGGVNTVRAEAVVAVVAGTDYDIMVIFDGNVHTAYLDGGNRITYTSSFLAAETTVGLGGNVVDEQFDNFHVHPRTSAVYDSVLGGV